MKKIELFTEAVRRSYHYKHIKMTRDEERKVLIYSINSLSQQFVHTNYIILAHALGLLTYVKYEPELDKCQLHVFA
ncbi:hypothetical protein ES707_06684 [subsurface metagenome]